MPAITPSQPSRTVYTVSGLNRAVKRQLDTHFERVWLEGELSNLSTPASGHWYFSLKDRQAQLRCAWFKGHRRFATQHPQPQNGDQVRVRGRITLYEQRGDYQLVVEHIEPAGQGALQQLFDQRKAALSAAGMFDADNKQPLPHNPHTIGVITSQSGAAFQDIRQVLARRSPQTRVILYPCLVQGDQAAEQIARRIQQADQHAAAQVLIVARGGGSMEDLWPFNEVCVSEAIAACSLPLITGVGHETDVSLADFAADQRAPTPSAAAELVSSDQHALLAQLEHAEHKIKQQLKQQHHHARKRLDNAQGRLETQHPRRQLQQRQQALDDASTRLHAALKRQQQHQQRRLTQASERLKQQSPTQSVLTLKSNVAHYEQRLSQGIKTQISQKTQRLNENMRALQDVSPLNTLSRGYAIIQRSQGNTLRSATQTEVGDSLRVRLHDGELSCTVEAKTQTAGLTP